jgi:small subunit ribosomal protein S21
MIIIDLKKEKSLDSALKKLKYKFTKTKTKEQLFENQQFTKKSVVKREQKRKAQYKQNLFDQSEEKN